MRLVLAVLATFSLALGRTHLVRPGETLYSIARRYGTTVEELARINGIEDPSRILAGSRLVIPEGPGWPEDWGLSVEPYPLVQGRPSWVRLEGVSWVELSGVRARLYRGLGLLPVPATLSPGSHPLLLADGRRARALVVSGGYATRHLTLPREKRGLLDPGEIRRERERILAACGKAPPEPLFRPGEPWRWPVPDPVVSAPFGERRTYDGRPGGYHAGMDLAAEAGTPVLAPAPGRVALAEEFPVRGLTVVIAHGLGVCSVLQHLSEMAVSPGEEVAPGDPVGAVGSSGLSTGPHLHFEVRVLGIPQDPMFFLEGPGR